MASSVLAGQINPTASHFGTPRVGGDGDVTPPFTPLHPP